jgi:plasmid maintenance system antidote protein VapI
VQSGLERAQRRDLGRAEDLRRVGRLDDSLQVAAGEIVGEEAQDLERELRVGEVAQRLELHRHDARPLFRHRQPAVGGEALQQDVGERLAGRVASRADVLHGVAKSGSG